MSVIISLFVTIMTEETSLTFWPFPYLSTSSFLACFCHQSPKAIAQRSGVSGHLSLFGSDSTRSLFAPTANQETRKVTPTPRHDNHSTLQCKVALTAFTKHQKLRCVCHFHYLSMTYGKPFRLSFMERARKGRRKRKTPMRHEIELPP